MQNHNEGTVWKHIVWSCSLSDWGRLPQSGLFKVPSHIRVTHLTW